MLSRWLDGLAALVVTLLTALLVIGEITDGAMRRWWAGHALATGTVSGLLVLLITLLVVDQVVRLRQLSDRARAVAAQAAIIMTQAVRASREVSKAVAQGLGPGDRDDARDEFRAYMNMLLVGAPVLINAKVSRNFLEQAQVLGGKMAHALATTGKASGPAVSPTQLDDAVRRLRAAASPLLAVLDPKTQAALRGDESPLPAAFSADGSVLATSNGHGTARVWDVAFPANYLQAACDIADVSFTRPQWAHYAGTQPFQQVCPAG